MKMIVIASIRLVLLTQLCHWSFAQSTTPFKKNLVCPRLTVTTTFDVSTAMYLYSYELSNSVECTQAIAGVRIDLPGPVKPLIHSIGAPSGWAVLQSLDSHRVVWFASDSQEASVDLQADDAEAGNSEYEIKPGQTLRGFWIKSPNPPGNSIASIQGLASIIPMDLAEVLSEDDFKALTDRARRVATIAPFGQVVAQTQAPSIDDFFLVSSPLNGAVLRSPIVLSLVLNRNGTQVSMDSLQVTLNGNNLSSLIPSARQQNSILLPLSIERNDLIVGKNVLDISIKGVNPDTGGAAFKIQRIEFYVNSFRDPDLDGDGTIGCSDIDIVRLTFGKRISLLGADIRADVNGDGMIDVRDLAFVSSRLPTGLRCN